MSFPFNKVVLCIVLCSSLITEQFMDSEAISPRLDSRKCCDCGCNSSSLCTSGTWLRTAKRKYDEFEDRRFSISGLDQDSVARVEAENEILALREMVTNQQQAIQDLISDLEEERNASSSAANEAMSMILRLQREKAEAQMEARQFKRVAEERMGHDQQEISALEDLLYKREQVIQSLTCEVHAYKHRMMSYGLSEAEAEGENSHERCNDDNFDVQYDIPGYEYPPLKCNQNDHPGALEDDEIDVIDIEKYPFGETPHSRDQLKNLEYRIHQMERSSSYSQFEGDSPSARTIQEKIIVGHSPRRTRHFRRFSSDSLSSLGMGRDSGFDLPTDSPRPSSSYKKVDYVSHPEMPSKLKTVYDASEEGDDMSDRIYTVDSIHIGVRSARGGIGGTFEDYITTPRESLAHADFGDPDIKKLYARLQALEADRESMRHAIISMQTDKAQLLLLKEIAQRLCKDASPERRMPAKKPSTPRRFSVISVFKWMGSIFWRKKARQCKYTFGLSPHHVGLLLLLEKSIYTKQLRCVTKAQLRG